MTSPKPAPSLFPNRYTPLNEIKEPMTPLLKRKPARKNFPNKRPKGSKR